MVGVNTRKSLLTDVRISVSQVKGCPCMGHLIRAVIKFSNDISCAMPIMQKAIEGCAYNAEVPVAAFRYQNMGVIVYKNEIIIYDAKDEAAARMVINFLEDIVNNTDDIKEKARTY